MTPLSLDSDADLGSVVIHYNKSIMPIMMVSAAGHSTEDRKVVSFLHSRKPSRCLRKACNDLPSPCIHRVNAERAREAFLVEQEEGAGAGERAEESIYFKAVKRLIAKKQRQEAFFGLQVGSTASGSQPIGSMLTNTACHLHFGSDNSLPDHLLHEGPSSRSFEYVPHPIPGHSNVIPPRPRHSQMFLRSAPQW